MFILMSPIQLVFGIYQKNVCTHFRKSKDRLSDLYYSMAKAYRKEDFDYILSKVGKVDPRVNNIWKKLDMKNDLDVTRLLIEVE